MAVQFLRDLSPPCRTWPFRDASCQTLPAIPYRATSTGQAAPNNNLRLLTKPAEQCRTRHYPSVKRLALTIHSCRTLPQNNPPGRNEPILAIPLRPNPTPSGLSVNNHATPNNAFPAEPVCTEPNLNEPHRYQPLLCEERGGQAPISELSVRYGEQTEGARVCLFRPPLANTARETRSVHETEDVLLGEGVGKELNREDRTP